MTKDPQPHIQCLRKYIPFSQHSNPAALEYVRLGISGIDSLAYSIPEEHQVSRIAVVTCGASDRLR